MIESYFRKNLSNESNKYGDMKIQMHSSDIVQASASIVFYFSGSDLFYEL